MAQDDDEFAGLPEHLRPTTVNPMEEAVRSLIPDSGTGDPNPDNPNVEPVSLFPPGFRFRRDRAAIEAESKQLHGDVKGRLQFLMLEVLLDIRDQLAEGINPIQVYTGPPLVSEVED